MLKVIFKWILALLLLALIALGVGLGWFYHKIQEHLTPPANPPGQESIVQYMGSTEAYADGQAPELRGEFAWEDIVSPPRSARAWTRWWWPGGDVDAATIAEQLAVLDAAGFGGVEVQPFVGGMSAVQEDESIMERVYQFDTASYYEALSAGIAAAFKRGMQFDLTHFSGWPPGGPEVNLEDSNTLIAYSQVLVSGGREVTVVLPPPRPGLSEYIFSMIEFAGADFTNFPAAQARLLSVVAGKRVGGERAWSPLKLDDTLELEEDSLQVIADHVTDGVLHWQAPEGEWVVVASYLMPSGEVPMGAAQKPQGFVIDHLRSPQVKGHYEFAYGERTGLPEHYGRGLRGFFNDSLEFRLKRMSVEDILPEFRARRGYDLEPYLPAIYIEGVDNVYFRELMGIHAAPEFAITAHDERIRADYQRTLSDLVIERFVETSAEWAGQRGLSSRGQSYGMDIDIIRALGANTIPETEQLWAGGSDAGLKFASSAAALYGRPLTSAESFVWINRDYASTARRIKAATDKLFLAGVNHIVYHGTPYPWTGGDSGAFGQEGWEPFSGPENPANFSSHVGPGNTALWPDIPALNEYIARSQNLLRQGAPVVDVLIYYPFLGFHGPNPEQPTDEALISGGLPDADPQHTTAENPMLTGAKELFEGWTATPEHSDERVAWVEKLQPVLRELDRNGITWAWVNAHALDSGLLQGGQMTASGGAYRAILLPDVDRIEPGTLAALESQVEAGLPVLLAGREPARQPGFLEAEQGDEAVRRGVRQLIAQGAVTVTFDDTTLVAALRKLQSGIPVVETGSDIKRYTRALADGSSIHFFANQAAAPQSVTLRVSAQQPLWWFDAREGSAWPAQVHDGELSLALAGFESRFLIEGRPIPEGVPAQSSASVTLALAEQRWPLSQWQLTAGEFSERWDELLDWRTVGSLKHSREGSYLNRFDLGAKKAGARYILDLGLVQGSAAVAVNGRPVGRASIPPFTLDITEALASGENTIEIQVQAPLRNYFVGRGLAGDPHYSHMVQYENQLVAAGLMGPVVVSRWTPATVDTSDGSDGQ